jgi:DNA-binding transcriptional regulator YdaS (Cro superfamily)
MKDLLIAAVDQAGGYSAVAAQLKSKNGKPVSRQAVWEWVNKTEVPATRVVELERIIGVPRHQIRPDVFPAEAV